MGNCMRISRAHVVVHDDEEKRVEELAQKAKEQSNDNKRRKSVRFKVVDDEEKKEEEGKEMMMKKGHVVRIRVVVTQEELKQILNGKLNFSSKDEFLRKIKSASRSSSNNNKRRLYEDGSNFSYGKVSCSSSSSRGTSWRPVLESIQEEH
ncbi:hypothetical protein MTR67_032416 [Solanum verrucosum]|uniref:Uncharacterized protein n=1 Tax=Solanum verrucosum TaxID=315347 RepID=A0AAF0ZFK6_SOLVR|nr:uncharacterized protein LOC125817716 [Solanum verrucosum]WMV39031.1 hypothetical protein MTR67_032416 [Solanum verrucosum]